MTGPLRYGRGSACWWLVFMAVSSFAQTTSPSFAAISAQSETARKANSPEAVALYNRALKINPAWKEGWWALGSIHYQLDHFADCRSAFEKLASLDAKSGPAWTMLGLCENGLKQYDAALAHLRQGRQFGVSNEAIDSVAKYQLARLLTKSGEFEQALGLILDFAQTGRDRPSYILLCGTAALWKPLFPEEIPVNDRELVLLAGRAFWDAGAHRAGEVQKSFAALLSKYPDSPGVHYIYGGYLQEQDPEQAVHEYEQELRVSPTHPGALIALGAEYLRLGEAAKGIPYARKCAEAVPDSMPAHVILGRLLALDGDLEGARRELELAKTLRPEDPQPHVALASVYAKLGRKQDAANERNEFIRLQSPGKLEK
jgi:tetratricopeptide (TPR) repeat protein